MSTAKTRLLPKYVEDALYAADAALYALATGDEAGDEAFWNRGGQGYRAFTRVRRALERAEAAGRIR